MVSWSETMRFSFLRELCEIANSWRFHCDFHYVKIAILTVWSIWPKLLNKPGCALRRILAVISINLAMWRAELIEMVKNRTFVRFFFGAFISFGQIYQKLIKRAEMRLGAHLNPSCIPIWPEQRPKLTKGARIVLGDAPWWSVFGDNRNWSGFNQMNQKSLFGGDFWSIWLKPSGCALGRILLRISTSLE